MEAEAGDDFVDDEQRVVHAGEFAEIGEEALLWEDDAHVGGDGLDDDGGDFVFVLVEDARGGVEVVVGRVERERGESFGDAGAFGDAERGEAGAGLREEAVGVAVVAAFEI